MVEQKFDIDRWFADGRIAKPIGHRPFDCALDIGADVGTTEWRSSPRECCAYSSPSSA